MSSQILAVYGKRGPEYTASQIAKLNVQKRQYQKEYMEYWNSTSDITSRPVDAVIAPIAPLGPPGPTCLKIPLITIGSNTHPSNYRAKFGNTEKRVMPSFTAWVNLLDYSAAVLPVTLADKNIDIVDKGYKPMNEIDKMVWESCMLSSTLDYGLLTSIYR
jgi:amidase